MVKLSSQQRNLTLTIIFEAKIYDKPKLGFLTPRPQSVHNNIKKYP